MKKLLFVLVFVLAVVNVYALDNWAPTQNVSNIVYTIGIDGTEYDTEFSVSRTIDTYDLELENELGGFIRFVLEKYSHQVTYQSVGNFWKQKTDYREPTTLLVEVYIKYIMVCSTCPTIGDREFVAYVDIGFCRESRLIYKGEYAYWPAYYHDGFDIGFDDNCTSIESLKTVLKRNIGLKLDRYLKNFEFVD